MCITSLEAELKNTIIGVWDIEHPEFGYRHVMAYQNSPLNLDEGPNAMILPVPSKSPIEASHILNTENDPYFLSEMADLVAPKRFTRAEPVSMEPLVVEMGIYHIAVLNELDESLLSDCLAQIPSHKRPKISKELFSFYQQKYPNYSLLICCFQNTDIKDASPIMLHFDPLFPDTFVFNTVEAHGEVPVLGEPKFFHQRILIGSHKVKKAFGDFQEFRHEGLSEELKAFVPTYGQGTHIMSEMPNYDVLTTNVDMATSDKLPMQLGIMGQN